MLHHSSLMSLKDRVSSAASCPGPTTSGYEASAANTEGEQGRKTVVLSPGKSPQTSHSQARSVPPVKFLDEFDAASLDVASHHVGSQGACAISFAACRDDEISLAALEGRFMHSGA